MKPAAVEVTVEGGLEVVEELEVEVIKNVENMNVLNQIKNNFTSKQNSFLRYSYIAVFRVNANQRLPTDISSKPRRIPANSI